jgi:hypothetical protein
MWLSIKVSFLHFHCLMWEPQSRKLASCHQLTLYKIRKNITIYKSLLCSYFLKTMRSLFSVPTIWHSSEKNLWLSHSLKWFNTQAGARKNYVSVTAQFRDLFPNKILTNADYDNTILVRQNFSIHNTTTCYCWKHTNRTNLWVCLLFT